MNSFYVIFIIGAIAVSPCCSAPPPVTALAYHPDGKLLAGGTYGEVVLIDPAKGEAIETLPGQTQRVTALAFTKKGDRLAVASGTPGKSGELRLYQVNENKATLETTLATAHNDVIYALTFSPDGKLLASAGYDRVIKLWSPGTKNEPRLLADHSDTVYGLAFHPDGALLASAAADRAVKVWDVASGKRLFTLSDPTDWVYTIAWSPEGSRLAAGGIDKSIRIWEANAEGGKLVHSVFAHTQPVTRLVYTADGKTLYSISEGKNLKSWNTATMKEIFVYPAQPETMLALALSPDQKQIALGFFDGKLKLLEADGGKTSAEPLPAKPKPPVMKKVTPNDRYPVVTETGPRDSPRIGLKITLPATLVGVIGKAGDADYFRFDVKAGQELAVQVPLPAAGVKFEPLLELTDTDGVVLADSSTGLLGYTFATAGTFALGIRDKEFRGGADFTYRMSAGSFPLITGVEPLSIQRGTKQEVLLHGVNLGAKRTVQVEAPATAEIGSKFKIPLPKLAEPIVGEAQVTVGEFPERVVIRDDATIAVPGTACGVIHKKDVSQTISFDAKKGQRLIVEVAARRLGSPLDSHIEILDAQNKPVMRATLRGVARTYSTFRDNDSAIPTIRLEAWNELAIDDYLFVNGDLMRIKGLPKGPDDDCQFYQEGGARLGFLDTTPTHHFNGNAMYKVEIHPPASTFPPNGLPTFPLAYRNDDGGPGYGKDSRLFFDPPADGQYTVRIRDARGQGGELFAYRLTVRPPRPDFTVKFDPLAPSIEKGSSTSINATATRIDGYDGPIRIQFANLSKGFAAPPTFIEPGQTTTTFPLYAAVDAGETTSPLKLAASAMIEGKEKSLDLMVTPKLAELRDIVTTTNVQEVTIQPGKETKLLVTIERRNGFAGRIPLEVRGLPHGVRVMNIGLNGILITERDTQREIVLYAEPWVKPLEHPLIVLAKNEKKKTEHGAKPVMLKVKE